MNELTERKFNSFSESKQHRIAAKLLNSIYRLQLAQKKHNLETSHYETYSNWLKKKPIIEWSSLQSIADAYHFHLKEAGIGSTEYQCLPTIEHFDKSVAKEPWPIHLYLDNLRSAHNVGSILRTVESFGLNRVFFSKETPWVNHRQVQKTSCNAYLFVDCEKAEDQAALPKPLIALETAADAESIYDFVFPESFTLAIGNEEYGCSKETLKIADSIIKIPLRGRKNSLNVANAFAITASEILRQRTYHEHKASFIASL